MGEEKKEPPLGILIPGSWKEEDQFPGRGAGTWVKIADLTEPAYREAFAEPNVIQHNYNQGILIVEGSHAQIIGNRIAANVKANIGLGGTNSGQTRITHNLIQESKSEGIFVIEGEQNLEVSYNWVSVNSVGLVLFNTKGTFKQNRMKKNQGAGVVILGQTTAVLDGNIIKGGDKYDENSNSNGLQIKDLAEPELRNNKIMWVKKDLDCEPRKHYKKMMRKIRENNNELRGAGTDNKAGFMNCSVV